jgi:hypothetical protein
MWKLIVLLLFFQPETVEVVKDGTEYRPIIDWRLAEIRELDPEYYQTRTNCRKAKSEIQQLSQSTTTVHVIVRSSCVLVEKK